jgi:hypothetical protein
MSDQNNKPKPLFSNIDASESAIASENGLTEIQSICMNCYKQVELLIKFQP